jgi:hypothetical protein
MVVDVDVFGDASASFTITYNGVNNVNVEFVSENMGKLVKSDDFNETIGYSCKFNEENFIENRKTVQNAEFNNGKYDFQLTFEPEKSAECYKPGEYSDNLTITVSEATF